MRTSSQVGALVFLLAFSGAGCGPRGPKGPTREAVTASLRAEAESLKRDGENLDPVLRVTATWNVVGLDVSERPDDTDHPWAGTIRFKIVSETKDTDGRVQKDELDKRFDYLYATSVNRWIFQMPPS
jgi:hypothetical protein